MSKEKTDNIKRGMMDRSKMHPNPLNPNEMQDKEFNLLCDNIQRVGLTDPILVIPHPEIKTEFMIIGGEHRWRAADLLGIDSVPYTLIDDPDFNMDDQKFQIVRHNIIHGKMSASKFMDLYSSLSEEYEEDIAAELFGFTDEEEFRKLIKATASSLPKDMQSDFVQAAKDINTIDDLSKLLNHMFATYGDTLNHGYMIMDYGGKDSLW
ncbi:MAG: ParB/RepB/Spo0J family partition protein, partial [Gammaproteobacteria bacterium]|nr:ParB/RepB/Spo0J family partition protein [Gammaproteobacteria bacterium]